MAKNNDSTWQEVDRLRIEKEKALADIKKEQRKLQEERKSLENERKKVETLREEEKAEKAMNNVTSGEKVGLLRYEEKTERVSRHALERLLNEYKRFGWNYDLEQKFEYKNGDVRIKFWRDRRDSNYDVWIYNEKMLKYSDYISMLLFDLLKRIKKEPGIKGIKKLFKTSRLCEEAFRRYEKEIEEDKSKIEKKYAAFIDILDNNNSTRFFEKNEIDSYCAKYHIKYNLELCNGYIEANLRWSKEKNMVWLD